MRRKGHTKAEQLALDEQRKQQVIINAKREIYNRKRRWQRANDARKRVLVAQDVLLQIEAGKFKPEVRSWLIVASDSRRLFNDDCSLQPILLDDQTKCTGCALGGAMMSLVQFQNGVAVRELKTTWGWRNRGGECLNFEHEPRKSSNENAISKQLKDLFGIDQVRLIEQAFELCDGAFKVLAFQNYKDMDNDRFFEEIVPKSRAKSPAWNAYKFGRRYNNDRDRLKAIMQNIIDNRGTFIP